MLTRSTKPSAKPLLVLFGIGLALLLLGVVVVVAVTRKNHDDSWPRQGTKWEGTLASTVSLASVMGPPGCHDLRTTRAA